MGGDDAFGLRSLRVPLSFGPRRFWATMPSIRLLHLKMGGCVQKPLE